MILLKATAIIAGGLFIIFFGGSVGDWQRKREGLNPINAPQIAYTISGVVFILCGLVWLCFF